MSNFVLRFEDGSRGRLIISKNLVHHLEVGDFGAEHCHNLIIAHSGLVAAGKTEALEALL